MKEANAVSGSRAIALAGLQGQRPLVDKQGLVILREARKLLKKSRRVLVLAQWYQTSEHLAVETGVMAAEMALKNLTEFLVSGKKSDLRRARFHLGVCVGATDDLLGPKANV